MKLSVIIPLYNEKNTVRELLERVAAVPLSKQIIIIDDCSTDGTTEVLKSLEREEGYENGFLFLYHGRNRGKGAAIRTAQSHVEGDIVIIQDGDLEYDPAEYPGLVAPIVRGDADVVYGSRFSDPAHCPLTSVHTMANRFLTFLSNRFNGLALTDMETCYKAFRSDVFGRIPIESDRFGFEPEVTARIARMKCRVREVRISYRGRTRREGKKISWWDGMSTVWTIIRYGVIDKIWPGRTTKLH